jgi:hypothetical protein
MRLRGLVRVGAKNAGLEEVSYTRNIPLSLLSPAGVTSDERPATSDGWGQGPPWDYDAILSLPPR